MKSAKAYSGCETCYTVSVTYVLTPHLSDTLSALKVSFMHFYLINSADKEIQPVSQRCTSVRLIRCSWETEH